MEKVCLIRTRKFADDRKFSADCHFFKRPAKQFLGIVNFFYADPQVICGLRLSANLRLSAKICGYQQKSAVIRKFLECEITALFILRLFGPG